MVVIIESLFNTLSTIDKFVPIMSYFLLIAHINLQLSTSNYQNIHLLKINQFLHHEVENLKSTILESIFQKQMNQMFYWEDTDSQYP